MKRLIITISYIIISSRIIYGQNHETENDLINSLIPEGWILLKYEKGDLNKDGFEDLAIVIHGTDPSKIVVNDGFGYDTLDTNPRTLLIFFYNNKNSKYELIKNEKGIIPSHSSPTMDDPFSGIEIKKGILEINYYIWYNAGSWYVTNETYKFRYQNNDFFLIGIEYENMHRGTMESKEISVNFSTRKMLVTEFSAPTYDENDDEHVEKKETWFNFTLDNLYKFNEIEPFNIRVLNEYL